MYLQLMHRSSYFQSEIGFKFKIKQGKNSKSSKSANYGNGKLYIFKILIKAI